MTLHCMHAPNSTHQSASHQDIEEMLCNCKEWMVESMWWEVSPYEYKPPFDIQWTINASKKPAILVIHRSGNHNQTHPMPHVQSAPSIILLPACYPRKSNWSHFPSSVANSCGISCAWSKALTIQAISTLSTTKFELCTFLFASVLLSTIRRLGCQMGQMLQVIAGNIVEYRANQIIS